MSCKNCEQRANLILIYIGEPKWKRFLAFNTRSTKQRNDVKSNFSRSFSYARKVKAQTNRLENWLFPIYSISIRLMCIAASNRFSFDFCIWRSVFSHFKLVTFWKKQHKGGSSSSSGEIVKARKRKICRLIRKTFIYRSEDLYSRVAVHVPLPNDPMLWLSVRSMHPLAFPSVALNHPENTR